MIRLHWLRHCKALALMLAVGATSGCINSDKFTSGRLPYGGADGLAATSPRDPFLAGGSQPSNETSVASATPTAPPTNYGTSSNAPYYAAVQNAASQAPQYTMQPGSQQAAQYSLPTGAPQSPQYAVDGMPAGAPMSDMRQVAYTPSVENPFNAPSGAPPASQPMPPQAQRFPSGSQIEQISYEMPAGLPSGSAYEANPFAEVQGAANVTAHQQMPQIQPMNGTTDAWQPSTSTSNGYAGEFLPPQ